VYVKFSSPQESQKAKDVFHGRQFDGNTISASFSSEDDFNKAAAGLWPGAVAQPLSPAGVLSTCCAAHAPFVQACTLSAASLLELRSLLCSSPRSHCHLRCSAGRCGGLSTGYCVLGQFLVLMLLQACWHRYRLASADWRP
jgi:hypothetical protein